MWCSGGQNLGANYIGFALFPGKPGLEGGCGSGQTEPHS